MMTKRTYLGLDFGGTKLRVGEVDADGRIIAFKEYPTGYCNQEQAIDIMLHAVDDYMANTPECRERIGAIGIGTVGTIDSVRGIWLMMDPDRNIPTPLAQIFTRRYGILTFVDNDVKSATTAELAWGQGRKMRNFVYINVGTGIAAGIVVGGKLLRGSTFEAGEVGFTVSNLRLTPHSWEYVENVAGGVGFDRCARLMLPSHPHSILTLPEKGRVSAKDIFNGYRKGDALCRQLVDNAADSLAILIHNLKWALDPEGFIMGGGVVADGFMLQLVKQRLSRKVLDALKHGITLTKLNPQYVGLLGAAAVAKSHCGDK